MWANLMAQADAWLYSDPRRGSPTLDAAGARFWNHLARVAVACALYAADSAGLDQRIIRGWMADPVVGEPTITQLLLGARDEAADEMRARWDVHLSAPVDLRVALYQTIDRAFSE